MFHRVPADRVARQRDQFGPAPTTVGPVADQQPVQQLPQHQQRHRPHQRSTHIPPTVFSAPATGPASAHARSAAPRESDARQVHAVDPERVEQRDDPPRPNVRASAVRPGEPDRRTDLIEMIREQEHQDRRRATAPEIPALRGPKRSGARSVIAGVFPSPLRVSAGPDTRFRVPSLAEKVAVDRRSTDG